MKHNKNLSKFLALSIATIQFGSLNVLATNTNNVTIDSNEDTLNSKINKDASTGETNDYTIVKNESLYSDNVFELLKLSKNLINEYSQSKDLHTLKSAIVIFCSTNELLDIDLETLPLLREDKNFKNIFNEIRDKIYEIEDNKTQSEMLIFYGEKIFIGWRRNKMVSLFNEDFLLLGLYEYNKDKNEDAQDRLEYLCKLFYYFSSNPDLDPFSDLIPDKNNYPPKDDEDVNDGNDNTTPIPPTENIPDNEDETEEDYGVTVEDNGFFTEYIKTKDNRCKKKTTYYKNGKVSSTKEEFVPKDDYVKCGIYNYVHSTINYKKPTTTIDSEYINSNQNEESNYTIHYTVNKLSKNPYYFNTGIRTTVNKVSSYNQLKDALYQLSIKEEGFFISDNDKSLTIIEGKPIVLKKSKDEYTHLEVERLLNSFNKCGFKIMNPSDNLAGSLHNYLSNKTIDTLTIDDKSVKLSAPFILIENQLYGPIQEIATLIGAKTSLKNNELTITLDSNVIKLKLNSKSYKFNKSEYSFESSPITHDSSIYCEINTIISKLGYDLSWDSETEKLTITTVNEQKNSSE